MLRFVPHSVSMRRAGFVRDPKAPFMTDPWVRKGQTQADLAKVAHGKRVIHRGNAKAERMVGVLKRFVGVWSRYTKVMRDFYRRREPKGLLGMDDNWGDLAMEMDRYTVKSTPFPPALWQVKFLEKLGIAPESLVDDHNLALAVAEEMVASQQARSVPSRSWTRLPPRAPVRQPVRLLERQPIRISRPIVQFNRPRACPPPAPLPPAPTWAMPVSRFGALSLSDSE